MADGAEAVALILKVAIQPVSRGGTAMNGIDLKDFLLWSTVINYIVLLVWFGALVVAHDWVYRLHTRWLKLSPAAFDAVHYGGMAAYKIGILLFNLVPLIALCVTR
ncbi:hypothetical protein YWS52_22480 [Chitiniphilus shinanonensis]